MISTPAIIRTWIVSQYTVTLCIDGRYSCNCAVEECSHIFHARTTLQPRHVATHGTEVYCFDCGAILTDKTDWEPFLVGVSEGMREVIAAYRARRDVPHVHIGHAPICFDCLDKYQAINHVKFHEMDNVPDNVISSSDISDTDTV